MGAPLITVLAPLKYINKPNFNEIELSIQYMWPILYFAFIGVLYSIRKSLMQNSFFVLSNTNTALLAQNKYNAPYIYKNIEYLLHFTV